MAPDSLTDGGGGNTKSLSVVTMTFLNAGLPPFFLPWIILGLCIVVSRTCPGVSLGL